MRHFLWRRDLVYYCTILFVLWSMVKKNSMGLTTLQIEYLYKNIPFLPVEKHLTLL